MGSGRGRGVSRAQSPPQPRQCVHRHRQSPQNQTESDSADSYGLSGRGRGVSRAHQCVPRGHAPQTGTTTTEPDQASCAWVEWTNWDWGLGHLIENTATPLTAFKTTLDEATPPMIPGTCNPMIQMLLSCLPKRTRTRRQRKKTQQCGAVSSTLALVLPSPPTSRHASPCTSLRMHGSQAPPGRHIHTRQTIIDQCCGQPRKVAHKLNVRSGHSYSGHGEDTHCEGGVPSSGDDGVVAGGRPRDCDPVSTLDRRAHHHHHPQQSPPRLDHRHPSSNLVLS